MRNLFLIALVTFGFACGGEIQIATDPGSVSRLTIVLRAASAPTIQRATLSLDGREVAVAAFPNGAAETIFDVTVSGVRRGEHSIRVFLKQQTSSPNAYSVGGGVGTQDRQILLAPVSGVLATGESLELVVNF